MPAGSERSSGPSTPVPLPVTFRPRGVRIATAGFGVLLFGTIAVVWLTIPGDARDSFTVGQRVTLALMAAGILAAGHAMARCRVDADAVGVTVVNGYRSHRLEWGQVVAVTLRPGNPWAVLDLSDGTTRSAMGIQGSDGARARQQTRQLQSLVAAHAGTEPPG